jgi:hypothetical protein
VVYTSTLGLISGEKSSKTLAPVDRGGKYAFIPIKASGYPQNLPKGPKCPKRYPQFSKSVGQQIPLPPALVAPNRSYAITSRPDQSRQLPLKAVFKGVREEDEAYFSAE